MPGKIEGSVVAIDEAGNLITDLTAERLRTAPTDDRARVRCDEHETNGIFPTKHNQPAATLVAFVNGTGRLELEIVGENTSVMLGIRVGEKVVVEW